MARRRATGSIYRRRLPGRGPDGRPRYAKGWYIRLRRHGRDVRRYGGPDRQTAREVLRRMEREIDREHLLGEHPEQNLTFSEFVPRFLAQAKREQTAASYVSLKSLVPNRLEPFFGRLKLRRVTPADAERYLASRSHVKGATRNRELSALRAIFQHAVTLGLLRVNPLSSVRRASEPQTPLPLVPLADQQRLLDRLHGREHLFVLVALETGLRLGELLNLDWVDVDFSTDRLLVRESKGKRPRLLALSARVRKALVAAKEERVRPLHGPDHVFPGARLADGSLSKVIRRQFKAAAATIGHPNLRVHDLRHLTAINLVRAGLDLPTVGAVLGHRSLLSTLRYAAYADDSAAVRAARALDLLHAPGAQGAGVGGS